MPPSTIDELYAAPLTEFTAARNALAARLRQQGRTAEAEAVTRLRKPTAVVWAVNQLARDDPAGLSAFLDAVKRLKAAQLAKPADLPATTQAQRGALQRLVNSAAPRLRRAGSQASPALVRRLSHTLMGAAADPRLADQLRRGRLTDEQQAPGFEVFGGQMPAGRSSAALAQPPRRSDPGKTGQPVVSQQEQRVQEARRAREATWAADGTRAPGVVNPTSSIARPPNDDAPRTMPRVNSRRRVSASANSKSVPLPPSRPPWKPRAQPRGLGTMPRILSAACTWCPSTACRS